MNESIILAFFKKFLDKYFLTTVATIPLTTVVWLFTSDKNWIIQKLGAFIYCSCAFCICFLLIHGIYRMWQHIGKAQKEKRRKIQFIDNEIEEFMDFFDTCEPWKRDLAYELLANGNQPVLYHHCPWIWEVERMWNYTQNANGTFQVKFQKDVYKLLYYVYTTQGKISHFAPQRENNTEVAE